MKLVFSRGYGPHREVAIKNSRFMRSCFNCESFYQKPEDDREVCQNPSVFKYDMVVTETTVSCNQWEIYSITTSAKDVLAHVGGEEHGNPKNGVGRKAAHRRSGNH
jgi:hypothetical protein